MGSGCSSPLKRFGGKKCKQTRNSSASLQGVEQIPSGLQQDGAKDDGNIAHQNQPKRHQKQLLLDPEITIQSELNDEHASSTSCNTDARNQNEDSRLSDQSVCLKTQQLCNETSQANTKIHPADNNNCSDSSRINLLARIKGLNGSYVPHDRHLLVSPALSPAPSTCYSPSPASSNSLDLADLQEAFRNITFGLPSNENEQKRIKFPQPKQNPTHNSPELLQYYSQQLNQTQNDLINYITVIFITTDHFQYGRQEDRKSSSSTSARSIDSLANHLEHNLRNICDEHLFKLRFLNFSQAHLNEHFHINNSLDATMQILEQEFKQNSQRTVIIIFSSNNSSSLSAIDQTNIDKKQLPSRIDTQQMIDLLGTGNSNLDEQAKVKLDQWYNQMGGQFYLKPIYQVYPSVLSDNRDERNQAWSSWLEDSSMIVRAIESFNKFRGDSSETNHTEIIELKSQSNSYIEFILKEPSLQKRTFLIKTLGLSNQQSQQQPSIQQSASNNNSLNELARLLSDSNKQTLKRSHSQEEFVRLTGDWINENFDKVIDSILESQISNGKHVPPFIDNNLFIELNCQRNHLHVYLDSVSENFSSKSQSFYSSQLLPILNSVFTEIVPEAQSPSAGGLVFISGPKGCGKSTLFAQLIKLTAQDFLDKAQIIYRFFGISLDSLSPNRLLRSICEQFCQTQGENIAAASYVYSARGDVISALNKIIRTQFTFVFLDGLDSYSYLDELSFDWLYQIESRSQAKIIVMLETDSILYKKALESYTDATFITLDSPSIGEWAQMLNSGAKARRFTSRGNIYEGIKNIESQDELKPSYRDASEIINTCRIRQLNNETSFPELSFKEGSLQQNFQQVFEANLSNLHYLIPGNQLCTLIVVLESSRNGLFESDIIKLMSLTSSPSSKSSAPQGEATFSASLFNYLRLQLQPWLSDIICDKSLKIIIDVNFAQKALQYYVSSKYPNIIAETREILYDYFNQRHTSRPRTSRANISGSKGSDASSHGDLRRLMRPAESLSLANQASELSHLLVLMNKSKAAEHLLNKNQFFLQFLHDSRPEEFIEDCERLRDANGRKPSYSDELQTLVSYIKQSIYPLRYDGSQIYSQIYCRAYETIKLGKSQKSKKLNEIHTTASSPPVSSLLPISQTSINSFIATRIGLSSNQCSKMGMNSCQSQTSQPPSCPSAAGSASLQQQRIQQPKQKIFTIKDNHRHMVVIYPDRGTLCVWDIYEERAVRTIQNLDHPRDLRMIDQQKAVVLCNRELRVYDLDSGNLVTRLKGVMNQKMPYFEVFGDNYVVALARNRMYVNMLNLNTGEMETTFKVGEDRFLNSLLVSANGGICVCGDETQKPFPLLVWNLNERRLLYDLRLDRHEFVTRMSAISDDGHFVVSVCKQIGESDMTHGNNNGSNCLDHSQARQPPNFIVIYDLSSGTLFKKWKPGLDTWGVAISYSANKSGKVISSMVDCSILVWDLVTGSKRHTLRGHSAPANIVRVQSGRLFSMDSSCCDQSLRIWDIEDGSCLAVFSPDAPVSCSQLSIRGDALVCGFTAESRLSTLVVCKNETVNDVVKRNKRRKSSKSLYIFDEPPSRKSSS